MIEIRHTDELRRGDVVVEEATPFTLPQVQRGPLQGLGDRIRERVHTGTVIGEEWRGLMDLAEEADTLVAHSAVVQRNYAAERFEAQRLRVELKTLRGQIRDARREAWDEGLLYAEPDGLGNHEANPYKEG